MTMAKITAVAAQYGFEGFDWSGDWWQYFLVGVILVLLPGIVVIVRDHLKPFSKRKVMAKFRSEWPEARVVKICRAKYGNSRAYRIVFIDMGEEKSHIYKYDVELREAVRA